MDRQVLALLVPDLSRDLHITDVQFGLLSGPAFILAYNLVLLVAAQVVDRWSRKWLIAAGAVIWTSMTIASGFAHSFHELLMLRAGVALGEAILGPAAFSMIGDMFDRLDRPLPVAVYIAGSVVGSTGSAMISAIALQVAGQVAITHPDLAIAVPWRLTLILVGVPGLLLGLTMMAVGREPPRPHLTKNADAPAGESMASYLRRHGLLYAGAFVGLGLVWMIGTALALWGPSYISRNFGLPQVRIGYVLGGISLAAGLGGTFALPPIFRNRFRHGKVDDIVRISAGTIAGVMVAAVFGSLAASLPWCLLGFGVAIFLLMGVGTLPATIIQLYAPSHLRGRISAAFFFTLYLLSTGLGPMLVPLFAHHLFTGQAAVGQAIGLVAVLAGGAGILCFAGIRSALRKAEADITAAPAVTAFSQAAQHQSGGSRR